MAIFRGVLRFARPSTRSLPRVLSRPPAPRAPLASAALAAVVLASPLAHAQQPPSLAGSWSAGALNEKVNVTSWVAECGPAPKSSSSGGGGYTISLAGDELAFSGSPAFRTDRCWDPGYPRVSHSATPAQRSWKTRCESPAGHALRATITTTVRAVDDDTIVMIETATYVSQMQSGSCNATVDRSRYWKRNVVAPPPTATATAAPPPPPPTAPTAAPKPTTPPEYSCTTTGDPATLEVRPRRKIIRAGEQFEFRARVLDAGGCELGTKPIFKLAPESSSAPSITVDAHGLVKAAADAEPIVATLVVEGAGKSAKVEIEVVSAKRYDELLATTGGDSGMDDQAVAIVVSGGGGGESLVRDPSTGTGRHRFAWLAIAGGVCSLLALAALVIYRKGNEQAARDEEARRAARKPKKIPLDPARPILGVPTPQPLGVALPPPHGGPPPGGGFGEGGGMGPVAGIATAPGPGRMCPSCGTSVPFPAEFCPNDGTRLPPATVVTGRSPSGVQTVQEKGRICPVCGARYEPGAMFCSKDGVSLVPIN